MIQFLLSALPVAVVWVLVTGRVSLDSLALGYGIGLVTLYALRLLGIRFDKPLTPDQPVALAQYVGGILWSGFRSSLKVVKLVLSPQIKLETGVIALNSGDLSEEQLLTALSAHSINTTPGEIVIDIADGGVLYIHCLNLEASRKVVEQEQAHRLRLFKRILGEHKDYD
jgi:multisubunit Na+/H+ antiporter MnhE subunit